MNFICKVFGNKARRSPGEPDIAQPKAPPMPAVKAAPVCNLRDFYDSAFALLTAVQVSEIVAHAQRKTSNVESGPGAQTTEESAALGPSPLA